MMSDDPGGVFASDAHRRVLAHLPLPGDDPMEEDAFFNRVLQDQGYEYAGQEEVLEVLKDVEADGYATQLKGGWRLTKTGLQELEKPPVTEEG